MNRAMRRTRAASYRLTAELLSQYGGPVLCLDHRAVGKRFALHSTRPDASLNRPIFRADVVQPDGATLDTNDLIEERPALVHVLMRGPLEQRAGYHECDGWSDGHDAVAERLINAFVEGCDVILEIDSPGGAHAGLQEAVARVVREKAKYGRRVTGYVNELCGSAAYWWAACVCDEIYIPEAGQIGSIGARAGHESVAAALAHEGVAVTYFAWPGPGKVAFAPELPLSDVGRERGDRDVSIAGEAFAAAVGPRRGLSRDEIVDLDADVLSGFAAVKAKLADGVASFEEVMVYALDMASRGENEMAISAEDPNTDPQTPEQARMEEPQKPGHAEPDGDEPSNDDESPDAPPGPPERAKRVKIECEGCGAEADEDAKYCDSCGAKFTSEEPSAPETDDEDDDDGEPDGDEEKPSAMRNQPPPEKQDKSTIAAIFGLRADASLPATKSAALAYAKLGRAVMAATGTKTPTAALGAFQGLVDDASQVQKLMAEHKAIAKRENYRERMALLNKLAAANLPNYQRGDIFVDREANGKRVVAPAPVYAEMKLGTLRGLVDQKIKSASPKAPAIPDRARAEEAHAQGLVEVQKASPLVKNVKAQSSASEEQIAKTAAALQALGVIPQ